MASNCPAALRLNVWRQLQAEAGWHPATLQPAIEVRYKPSLCCCFCPAILGDGSVITWGSANYGGDCDFNQSLEGIQLPIILRSLTFARSSTRGCDFNQSLEGIKLPKQLANFDVCEDFNQGLDGIHLLSSLRSLTLGCDFNQSLEGIKLPSSLQTLTFVRISTRAWMASIYPAACRV